MEIGGLEFVYVVLLVKFIQDVMKEGHIFYKYKLYLIEKVPLKFAKPLGLCPMCMSVWITLFIHIITLNFSLIGLITNIIISHFLIKIYYEEFKSL